MLFIVCVPAKSKGPSQAELHYAAVVTTVPTSLQQCRGKHISQNFDSGSIMGPTDISNPPLDSTKVNAWSSEFAFQSYHYVNAVS